jgi:hypothetical protein
MKQLMPTDNSSLSASRISASTNFRSTRWLRWLFVLLVVCYGIQLVQAFSPLRIDGDGIDYLTAAASAADGEHLASLAKANMRPLGYSLMIAALDRLGIARPWSLVALNCGWLLVGLLASYAIARKVNQLDERLALLTCLLTILSFSITKHTALVASDIPYFGLSLATLATFGEFGSMQGKVLQQIVWLVGGILLLIAATLTRSIGVTLLPALGWSVLQIGWVRRRLSRRFVIGGIAFVTIAVAVWWGRFVRSDYGGLFIQAYRRGMSRSLVGIAFMRLKQLGELTLNIPIGRFSTVRSVSWIVGSIVVVLLLLGIYRRRRWLAITDVYLLSYLGTLLLAPWAGGAGRYLIPIVPIVIVALITELQSLWARVGWARAGVYGIGALYVSMGVVAMGYSTWITFSGPKFPERYGDGRLTATYRLFLLDQPPAAGEELNPQGLKVLQRYGGRRK